MKLFQLLNPDRIKLDIQAKDREGVIEELVNLLAEAGDLQDHEAVSKMVIDREMEVGTGIGYGVAIPHTEPGPFHEPLAALGRLTRGIDFQAPDSEPARLIFLLLTPESAPALHVRLLARICRLLKSEELRRRLLSAENPRAAAEAIAEAEADFPELTL